MSNTTWDGLTAEPYRPEPEEVEQLIGAARNHPLGVSFLLEGDLASVAVTFETHAFTVEAARAQLAKNTPQP